MMWDLARQRISGVPAGEEQDLRQILVVMQYSLTQIDGKIDSLSYRMDRMTERLDKHAERLDQLGRGISEVGSCGTYALLVTIGVIGTFALSGINEGALLILASRLFGI
ncbi:hypothetical protein NDU88_006771 [Pleurodeles waltl]|uniref:Uncharacterized protein n=1 Tax=Pleurodeles waltl TaxID=8319 RepID=A0AAV7QMX4_PLEWA|nr:hypothetical protein NDU88_006771 [Pleurodeles waltl]